MHLLFWSTLNFACDVDGVHTEIPIPSSAWDFENETVWLTQAQLAELYKVNVPTVSKQIQNVFDDEELQENATISKMEIVQTEGNREVSRQVTHYNLEMLIALGYSIKSKVATKFRQWATQHLTCFIYETREILKSPLIERRLIKPSKFRLWVKSPTPSRRKRNALRTASPVLSSHKTGLFSFSFALSSCIGILSTPEIPNHEHPPSGVCGKSVLTIALSSGQVLSKYLSSEIPTRPSELADDKKKTPCFCVLEQGVFVFSHVYQI